MADIKFTGNLGRDAELKYTKSGSPFMSFSVADSRSRKTEGGDWETLAEQWLECTIWGSLAEHYDGKLTRGSRVTVYGDFMSRKYEAKDGSAGTSLDVNVKGVDILPSKNSNGQQRGNQQQSGGNRQPAAKEDPWATPAVNPNNGGGWGNGPDSEPPF
ncbi:single-stranded DNA-binding protein [Pseudarthrobacter sp. S6]|uniref:single-stranded DNA-binding protein n=1 Tax=Pseudarthrobacter sp. S6 TaxID=3418420 RepID=UPI003CF64217